MCVLGGWYSDTRWHAVASQNQHLLNVDPFCSKGSCTRFSLLLSRTHTHFFSPAAYDWFDSYKYRVTRQQHLHFRMEPNLFPVVISIKLSCVNNPTVTQKILPENCSDYVLEVHVSWMSNANYKSDGWNVGELCFMTKLLINLVEISVFFSSEVNTMIFFCPSLLSLDRTLYRQGDFPTGV